VTETPDSPNPDQPDTTAGTLAPAPLPAVPDGAFGLGRADVGILRLTGEDRFAFLQGLVSNDVAAVSDNRAIWAAFLTPQGKYLHDMVIAALGDALVITCEGARRDDLLRRLRLYRLRSRVDLADVTAEMGCAQVYGSAAADRFALAAEAGAAAPQGEGVALVDPRHPALGVSLIGPRDWLDGMLAGLPTGDHDDWEAIRLDLGIPDGSRDLIIDKSILLENGFDELNGVSWSKGCYMGQELTARTKYRGLVKKRLMPVRVDGPPPPPGTPLMLDGREMGEIRSGQGTRALALVRLEAAVDGRPLIAGDATVTPLKPAWARF
jgi:folate-binding protein YgfZ